MGADPAVGEYLPVAPVSDEARKHNERLPGMGGVFMPVNLQVYHYAGNNPHRYVDPTGAFGVPGALFGGAVGGIVGAVTGGVSAALQGEPILAGAAGGAISGAVTGALVGSGVGIPLVLAGSFVGGATGSVVETAISNEGFQGLNASAVVTDAIIDGAISAVAAAASHVIKGVVDDIVSSAWDDVTRTYNLPVVGSGAWAEAFDRAMGAQTSAEVLKPIIEAAFGLATDIVEDNTGPDVGTDARLQE